MAVRYFQTADRLIISKPGFNANDPNLRDEDKLLDSNWDFSGVLIASGVFPDPAPAGSVAYATAVSAPLIIPFTDPGYIPAAYLFSENIDGYYGFKDVGFTGIRQTFPVSRGVNDPVTKYSTVHRGYVEVVRPAFGSGEYIRYVRGVRYQIYGVSQ